MTMIIMILMIMTTKEYKLNKRLSRPGTGKIWTVEGDEKLDEKMEEGDLKRFSCIYA